MMRICQPSAYIKYTLLNGNLDCRIEEVSVMMQMAGGESWSSDAATSTLRQGIGNGLTSSIVSPDGYQI
jgi:hypothetical protein